MIRAQSFAKNLPNFAVALEETQASFEIARQVEVRLKNKPVFVCCVAATGNVCFLCRSQSFIPKYIDQNVRL